MDPNFEYLIKCLLSDGEIFKLLKSPLTDKMSIETQMRCRSVGVFFEEFHKLDSDTKVQDFITVSKDISEWIPRFLGDTREAEKYRLRFTVIFELLKLQMDDAVKCFPMSEVFLRECCSVGLITESRRDALIAKLMTKGETEAKYQLLAEVSFFSEDAYSHLLVLLYKSKCVYIEKFCDDLHKSIKNVPETEAIQYIKAYSESIINKNMNLFRDVEKNGQIENKAEFDCSPAISAGEGIGDVIMAEPNDPRKKDFGNDACKPVVSPSFPSPQNSPTASGNSAKLDESKDSSESSDNDDEGNVDENLEMDYLLGDKKNMSSFDLLNFPDEVLKIQVEANASLKVRDYQTELANEGIRGSNVLICAPTGSGKTIVAVKIVEEHLKNHKDGKVAFIVHRIALVEQQYAQFSRYLKCRITRLSGSAKNSCAPLIGHIPSFDVFVMTSDILRNALEQDNETKLESVGAFTLILFDECHNCDKKHPYNRIMTHYFMLKREHPTKVPQIIGLTASTGTNKANTMDKAMKRLYTLCANLDASTVSTVKKCLNELKENQSVPNEEIVLAPSRVIDNFDNEMQKLMAYCERLLQGMNDRDFFRKDTKTQSTFSIPEDRMHQKYANFVGKLETRLLNSTKIENEGREAIYAISRYLNALVKALMVNHLFRAQDSVKLLLDSIETTSSATCKVEKALRKRLKKLSEDAECTQTDNPCLMALQERIQKQLEQDKTSRIIVFVRERTYTQILKDVFAALNDPTIKCDTIVGNTISAEKGGLTQNEMEEVLGRFRKGKCNVLFSTTVAEEGLDVQTCNLVIRYGHVTNETAMVQSRGRARALDSKYVVIVPSKLQWQVNKENINKYRESMMYKAIEKFQALPEAEREHQVEECRCERLLMETAAKGIPSLIKKTAGLRLSGQIWHFRCKKCLTEICTSEDVRIAENAHHLVINTKVFDRMTVLPEKKQILCKKCSNLLGNRQSYKSRFFPTLTITSFSLLCDGEEQSRSFKKWRDVPFEVVAVKNQELLKFPYDHCLSD